MPALFTLPKTVPLSSGGSLLPGSKLYFYRTATTTPQNTYQDIALATPHANPVIADAAGVFAPIYLDASLPHYRVKLTTSADVQIYQLDDVPSNQNTAQTFRLKSTAPELILEETDATANNQKWSLRAQSNQLTIDILNDAESSRTTIATFTRSGTTASAVNFAAGILTLGGNTVPDSVSSSFTGTLTGCTAVVTGSIAVARVNDLIYMNCSTSIGAITGTSNSTSMTITGVPSGFRPKSSTGSRQCFCIVTDNGISKGAIATISTAGVISFGLGVDGSTAFTAAGTKGLPTSFTMVYCI
jgi:hypothetical protein